MPSSTCDEWSHGRNLEERPPGCRGTGRQDLGGGRELHEAREEMRMLTVERRKAEAQGLRVSDIAGAGVGCEAVSGARSSE